MRNEFLIYGTFHFIALLLRTPVSIQVSYKHNCLLQFKVMRSLNTPGGQKERYLILSACLLSEQRKKVVVHMH